MNARGEGPNDMRRNGELRLQREIVDAVSQESNIVLFDVGANDGLWSESALDTAMKEGRSLSVWAFEPVPATYARLLGRLGEHPMGGAVQYIRQALSDVPGRSTMTVGPGGGETSMLRSYLKSEDTVEVEVTTLDAFCESRGVSYIHMVKCDAD